MYIPEKLRLSVFKRAGNRCEYCLMHKDDSYFPFEIDHIISLRHEGQTILINLALSCNVCNRNKSSDIGTYLDGKKKFVRLFNPRTDKWAEHFEINLGEILALTPIGRATVKLLNLNDPDRIILRQVLISANRYP